MKDYRLEKLAKVLVNYSTKVKPGDNVCVSGEEITNSCAIIGLQFREIYNDD